ncbi:MAG: SH3 domain-containing protein [Clostridiales bacterium]|nr:SH3 domain-containing protein [Clostridiales bacterium]
MIYAVCRWWREQREIRRLMQDFKPHTGRAALLAVACGLLAWLLMIVWASAGAEVTRYVDVEPGSYLNVREGPGTSEPVLYTLEAGSFVTVLTEDGGWVKLRTSRGHGWALGSYLVEMPAWLEVEEDPPGGV